MRDAFIRKLAQIVEANPKVMLMVGDVGFNVFDNIAAKFPRQFLNAGIAEQNMIGVSAGLALQGRIVFVYSIVNFTTLRCLEQIRNDICYHNANVKIVGIGSGFSYGNLGMSHHATEDVGVLRTLPGMNIVCPGDDEEASLATAAIADSQGPFYLRLDRSGFSTDSMGQTEPFRLAKARRIREGKDITLMSTGSMLSVAACAVGLLASQDIDCRLVSMHTIKPLDTDAVIDCANNTGGIITIEEHARIGGLGSAVAETCMDHGLYPRVFCRIALDDKFSAVVGDQNYLRSQHGLDATSIAERVKNLLQRG